MQYLGLDLGSRQVKLVLMSEAGILRTASWHTGKFYRQFARSENGVLTLALEGLDIEGEFVGVTTGYGRNHIAFKDMTAINELKAHSLGAVYQSQATDFTLLDVGGQDVKVLKIRNGLMVDMNLNDKCAASCGRFLEQMAEVLDMELEVLMDAYEAPVALSSTCAVFCESELIGKMAEGYPTERLAAGVNEALFKRIEPLLKHFPDASLWLSGGVSSSAALQHALSQRYASVRVLQNPVYNGAIGCCLYAKQIMEVI